MWHLQRNCSFQELASNRPFPFSVRTTLFFFFITFNVQYEPYCQSPKPLVVKKVLRCYTHNDFWVFLLFLKMTSNEMRRPNGAPLGISGTSPSTLSSPSLVMRSLAFTSVALLSLSVLAQDGRITGQTTSPQTLEYSCDSSKCQLPNCNCASASPPGGLQPVSRR